MPVTETLSRRTLLVSMPLLLAGCATHRFEPPPETLATSVIVPPQLAALYGELPDELHPIPAVDFEEVDPEVLRRVVSYSTAEQPGTLIVDTRERALFLIMEGGQALRYGVGVGKEGMAWSGRAVVGRKAEWPRWTPTREMIAREPERNGPWAGGMQPGLQNPLGARALYLYRNGRDSFYRIHGTNEPWSIGKSVSSGCIRMINQDVVDLYRRVPVGAPVVVKL
jgi:lipoprotein-anchoring transpeptidase ErfK/SrfK